MWSIIDFGLRDFLRFDGKPAMFESYEQAESWLLHRGEEYGWTNKGIRFFCWSDADAYPLPIFPNKKLTAAS